MNKVSVLGQLADLVPSVFTEPEAFYRTILDSLTEGVLILDADHRIRYTNRAAHLLTRYAPDESLGQTIPGLLFPEAHSQENKGKQRDPFSERVEGVETRIRRKDGQLHWVYFQITPFRNAAGEIVGRVVALSCIERQKALEFENELLHEDIQLNFGAIIGQSPVIRKVLAQISTVGPTEANVLVLGE